MVALRGLGLVVGLSTAVACGAEHVSADAPVDTDAIGGDTSETGGALPEGHAEIVHSFGRYDLGPLEEVEPCVTWKLRNEKPIYVNRVTMTNNGGFHHSNWLVVPDDLYDGPDGFFDCGDRNYNEFTAAISGSVLFAQSTQSRIDGLELPAGVVVKIPPHHRIIAGAHLLNLSNQAFASELRIGLELIHPQEVQTVVAPFRLTYLDLDIPGGRESRFTGDCKLATTYSAAAGKPLDLKIYYVIPHYHYLGNFFDLSILGGPQAGQSIYRLEAFNAQNNGRAYDPPVDITGADGLRFTCGYDNWQTKSVGWGIGDQEMCVMLGLADSAVMMDAGVSSGNAVVGEQDGVLLNAGPCQAIGIPKNANQGPPSAEEIGAPLYVPPVDPADAGVPAVLPCVDVASDAAATQPATLESISDTLFASSCTFSACHFGANAAAGLDLAAVDLRRALLEHDPQGNTDLPLVEPGDPQGSWLYQLIAECKPTDRGGQRVAHMPRNGPTLADPGLVAKVREWIEAGAN